MSLRKERSAFGRLTRSRLREASPNQRLKLTGAAILVFRASTSLAGGPGSLAERSATEACVKQLPKSDNSLMLRTDFSDDAAWAALCDAVQVPSKEGFLARLECISDPAYDGLTVEQPIALSPKGDERGEHSFAFIADRATLSNPEQPVLVVDLYDEPGQTFRVIPREMWGVENNLSIANMDVV